MDRPAKRRATADANRQSRTPTSLTRSISPPGPSRLSKRARISQPATDDDGTSSEPEAHDKDETSSEADDQEGNPISSTALPQPGTSKQPSSTTTNEDTTSKPSQQKQKQKTLIPSPFHLTKITPIHTPNDYPPEFNMDSVTLSDLVGDPLISEIWEFNYLHDIDFLMSHFDPDVRHLVRVHVIHGFWKKEDPNRLALAEQASRYANVELHGAFMPEMFGTHHSKMMILLRHDDTAEIVIHTANMIARDWGGMTQAVWRSPRVPLLPTVTIPHLVQDGSRLEVGSGERFKVDFLNYLLSYEKRRPTCRGIIEELGKYDFSGVKGCLIGSVPGRHSIQGHDGDGSETLWGWAAIKQALKAVPVRPAAGKQKAEVVIQISSIATLGPTDNWLRGTLFEAFSAGKVTPTNDTKKAASKMMGLGGGGSNSSKPDFKIIFPTADEIRNSLDGYNSGGSIHTKISSAQQKKQLAYLKPMFYHWGNETPCPPPGQSRSKTKKDGIAEPGKGILNAGRNRAAPHIKTYIRYSNLSGIDGDCENGNVDIEWALLTSANLSKQAWGEAPSSTGSGEMRIASYELGVLVWPGLFAEGAVMRGAFLTDTRSSSGTSSSSDKGKEGDGDTAVVGLRMPYSLPLRKYGKDEIPWVATASYDEPDWRGCYWRD